MIDEFANEYLHHNLRWARQSLLGKLEGLSEYDVRRPLTTTGTNLLGLVKHLTLSEARYLGEILDRPYPEPVFSFYDPGYANHDHMWVSEEQSRGEIIEGYQRACRHADATIEALPVDAPGFVPWWPRPDVKLFNVMVHVSPRPTGTPATPTSCASSWTARSGTPRVRRTTASTGTRTGLGSSGRPAVR